MVKIRLFHDALVTKKVKTILKVTQRKLAQANARWWTLLIGLFLVAAQTVYSAGTGGVSTHALLAAVAVCSSLVVWMFSVSHGRYDHLTVERGCAIALDAHRRGTQFKVGPLLISAATLGAMGIFGVAAYKAYTEAEEARREGRPKTSSDAATRVMFSTGLRMVEQASGTKDLLQAVEKSVVDQYNVDSKLYKMGTEIYAVVGRAPGAQPPERVYRQAHTGVYVAPARTRDSRLAVWCAALACTVLVTLVFDAYRCATVLRAISALACVATVYGCAWWCATAATGARPERVFRQMHRGRRPAQLREISEDDPSSSEEENEPDEGGVVEPISWWQYLLSCFNPFAYFKGGGDVEVHVQGDRDPDLVAISDLPWLWRVFYYMYPAQAVSYVFRHGERLQEQAARANRAWRVAGWLSAGADYSMAAAGCVYGAVITKPARVMRVTWTMLKGDKKHKRIHVAAVRIGAAALVGAALYGATRITQVAAKAAANWMIERRNLAELGGKIRRGETVSLWKVHPDGTVEEIVVALEAHEVQGHPAIPFTKPFKRESMKDAPLYRVPDNVYPIISDTRNGPVRHGHCTVVADKVLIPFHVIEDVKGWYIPLPSGEHIDGAIMMPWAGPDTITKACIDEDLRIYRKHASMPHTKTRVVQPVADTSGMLFFTDVQGKIFWCSAGRIGVATQRDPTGTGSTTMQDFSGSSVDGACGSVVINEAGDVVGVWGAAGSGINNYFFPVTEEFIQQLKMPQPALTVAQKHAWLATTILHEEIEREGKKKTKSGRGKRKITARKMNKVDHALGTANHMRHVLKEIYSNQPEKLAMYLKQLDDATYNVAANDGKHIYEMEAGLVALLNNMSDSMDVHYDEHFIPEYEPEMNVYDEESDKWLSRGKDGVDWADLPLGEFKQLTSRLPDSERKDMINWYNLVNDTDLRRESLGWIMLLVSSGYLFGFIEGRHFPHAVSAQQEQKYNVSDGTTTQTVTESQTFTMTAKMWADLMDKMNKAPAVPEAAREKAGPAPATPAKQAVCHSHIHRVCARDPCARVHDDNAKCHYGNGCRTKKAIQAAQALPREAAASAASVAAPSPPASSTPSFRAPPPPAAPAGGSQA